MGRMRKRYHTLAHPRPEDRMEHGGGRRKIRANKKRLKFGPNFPWHWTRGGPDEWPPEKKERDYPQRRRRGRSAWGRKRQIHPSRVAHLLKKLNSLQRQYPLALALQPPAPSTALGLWTAASGRADISQRFRPGRPAKLGNGWKCLGGYRWHSETYNTDVGKMTWTFLENQIGPMLIAVSHRYGSYNSLFYIH